MTNVTSLFGNAHSTTTAMDYTTAKQGTTHWNVPTANKADIGLTLMEQCEAKGLCYDVVGKENLTYDNDGVLIPTGSQTVFNATDNKPLAVMGSGYPIVPPTPTLTKLFNGLENSDIDLSHAFTTARVDNDGGKQRLGIVFPSTSFDVAVGDTVATSLNIIQSFDGSSAFYMEIGLHRFICANGMQSLSKVVCYSQKHTKSLNVNRAIDVICQGMSQINEDKESLIEQTKTMVNKHDVYQALCTMNNIDMAIAPTYEEYQKVVRPTLKRQPAIERHWQLWNKYRAEMGSTQWALHNMLTHISTHGDKPEYSGGVSITTRQRKEALVRKALGEVLAA